MADAPRVILVEDDPLQAEWIAEQIIWKKLSQAELKYFDSEFSFLEAINNNDFRDWIPQYAVIDLMVRYYSPDDLAKMAIENKEPNLKNLPLAKTAGSRCREALLNKYPGTKVVIVTVLDDQVEESIVIQKGEDQLVKKLGDFLVS